MKVYFVASVSGKNKYEEYYSKIIEVLENLDVELVANHVLEAQSQALETVSRDEEKEFYSKLKKWINEADVVVAEVSHRSTSVGHEVSLALSKNKPVIILHLEGKTPTVFKGIDSDHLQLVSYTPETIESELKYALDYAQENRDTRFNFFISPRHQNYLDWIAKTKKIPRSVFLRQLIDRHMEENEDYS